MNKSPDAFRTISEVAEVLEIPAHVLRFWESRFPQVRPVKRAGGRRYYRPADVALLVGIKRLLHDEGMTIRGVQKILREQGVRMVSGVPDMPVDGDAVSIEADVSDAAALNDDAFAGAAEEDAFPSQSEVALLHGALDARGSNSPTDNPVLSRAFVPDSTPPWPVNARVPVDEDSLPGEGKRVEGQPPSRRPGIAGLRDAARHSEGPARSLLPTGAEDAQAAPPVAADPAPPLSDIASETADDTDPAQATPAARLRAVHAAALPLPRVPMEALATRLAALRSRMSAAARPHRR